MRESSVLCPRCGRATERAGAAAERLSHPEETGSTLPETPDEEAEREEKARLLARPEEPEAFSLFGWSVVLLIPFLNVLSLFIAPFTLGLKLFMGVAGLVYVGVVVWYAAGTFIDPFAAQDAAMMTGFTTFALYFVALFHSWRVERRDVRARRFPAWSRSVERWEHLMHCAACSTVFLDDEDGPPVPLDRAPELTGTAEWEGRPSARTPIWLWALLAAIAVGGGRTALSWARDAVTEPEPLAPASPGMWEDIEADPVHLDTAGAGDSTGLDGPLLKPDGTAPDTTGT
ncbi:MAG TPA: hypothetical protein VLH75_04290 [Longimicrobiales bacterium]|nr:hypothetical protein [Longimicrobiales bacterium]